MMPEFFDLLPREAKLILNGQKHEFVMQLKPESLGKVTLQILTENGVVNARFVVENELARENLQASLEQLKQALNGQGLSVQGCTVEVRQDGEYAARNGNNGGTGRRGVRNAGAAQGEAGISGVIDAGRRAFLRDMYFEQQSSVHFTA